MKINYKTISKNFFEQKTWQKSQYLCGIDEVGRGSLAGPMLTAAVILHQNKTHPLLKDSKLLTKEERETAYHWIIKNSFYSFALASHHTIDKINIYQATLYTMKQALLQLLHSMPITQEKLKCVLIDAVPLDLNHKPQYKNIEFISFDKGETRSTSVAAASIVAKVTRDALMQKFDTLMPAYTFKKNKGYASKDHTNTLKHFGPSIIHRTTFIKTILKEEKYGEKQKRLFC